MPSAAKFWTHNSGSHAGSGVAADWFPVPLATARRLYPSWRALNGGQQPKRHETVWRTVAIGKGRRDNKWRDLAAVPKSLPGPARLNDERSVAGRVCPGSTSAGSRTFVSADAIGFTIPVATASRAGTCRDWNRRVWVSAGSSVPVPWSDRGLGQ